MILSFSSISFLHVNPSLYIFQVFFVWAFQISIWGFLSFLHMLVQRYSVPLGGGVTVFTCFVVVLRESILFLHRKVFILILFSFYDKFLRMLLAIFHINNLDVPRSVRGFSNPVGTIKGSILTNSAHLPQWLLASWLCWSWNVHFPLICNWSLKCSWSLRHPLFRPTWEEIPSSLTCPWLRSNRNAGPTATGAWK